MKKLIHFLLTLCLTVSLVASVACAENIVTYGGTLAYEVGYEEFLKDYPNTTIDWPDQVYPSTSAFTTALLTREFDCDLFTWPTNAVDWPTLIDKGYCLDLSGSHTLMEMVGQMHPRIAEQAMKNGRLYALPTNITFRFYQINEDIWTRAGFTLADVPQSFPELLDFLERWCDRIEEEPKANIRVIGGWDSSSYTKSSYISLLSHMLIEESMMQMQYAGEQLYFDDPVLLTLLERCFSIGERLYRLEPHSDTYALLEESARDVWPASSDLVVYRRLNDAQPKLMEASVSMWAVYPSTDKADLCIALLEQVAADRWLDKTGRCADLLLYRDPPLLLHPNYEFDYQQYAEQADSICQQLVAENLNADERAALEDELALLQHTLQTIEDNKWIMTTDQLADYQSATNGLFFPAPTVFHQSSTGYETLNSLCDRFANKIVSAQQLLTELNRVVQMLLLEQ